MEIDTKSSSIRWGCRRGMLELDLILLPFFDKNYSDLHPELKKQFAELLNYSDPELYDILIVQRNGVDPKLSNIIERIIND